MRGIALAICLLLAGCGGGDGGPSASGTITPAPATLRTDLLFGYYFGCADDIIEQADHVNLYWATGSCSSSGTWFLDMARELATAKGAGIRNVVLMPWPNMVKGAGAPAEAAFQFQRLAATGALAGWDSIMVYPVDEPDVNGWSDEQVTAMLAAVRAAMTPIPELARAKLGVIYNCSSAAAPGLAAYDWIGCDNYNVGCGALVLLEAYPLAPGQRLMVLPGGADPWRQDPTCFLTYAETHSAVVAIVPFIWQTAAGHAGIRVNQTRPLYCRTGRTVLTPVDSPTC
jgi:hypothetical protein